MNDGSCIAIVKGCTVRAQYHDVDSSTPKYDSSFVGVPYRSSGAANDATPLAKGEVLLSTVRSSDISFTYPLLQTVLNYDAASNYLEGCVVAIEGCMDSTAV